MALLQKPPMQTLHQKCVQLLAVCLCGLISASAPAAPPTETKTAQTGEVTISAAASTKEVIELLAGKFTEQTGVKVLVNLGPSSGLATQILAGAPVDLFLSANQEWADKIDERKQAESQHRLLTNRLVLIVPKGNPAKVREPKDLRSTAVKKIALAGEKVPAGKYADQALTKLGLLEELVATGKIARGQDVRSALSYVERGEAEAGIVYSTDVSVAPEVELVHELNPALHDEIVYVLVLLKRGQDNPATKKLYEFLQSKEATEAYAKFGFSRAGSDEK